MQLAALSILGVLALVEGGLSRNRCVGPFALENGSAHPQKIGYQVGEVVHFECDPDYGMFGSPNRTCRPNGEWSGRTTICDMGETFCPNPGSPVGGQRQGNRFDEGDEVRYSCLKGFVLRGSASRTCQSNGQWSGAEPRCEGRYAYDEPEHVAQQLHLSLLEEVTAHAHKGSRVYFLMDASGSVGGENFKNTKEFVLKFMDVIKKISENVKFSAISFASTARTVVNMLPFEAEAAEALNKFTPPFGASNESGTNTGAALQEVLKDIKNDEKSYKNKNNEKGNKVPKTFIVLVTDGKHNMGCSPYVLVKQIETAIQDPQRMLDIFSIGIGDAYKEELDGISTKKDQQRSFYLQNYGDLHNVTVAMDKPEESVGCGARGGPTKSVGRIYKSEQVVEKQWPWQVFVSTKGSEKGAGGSIISQRWILTAAHVVFHDNGTAWTADEIQVLPGQITRKEKHQVDVEQVIVHEKYNHAIHDFDIALLKLKNDLTFSNKIWPVCLPCTDEMNKVLSLPAVAEKEKCIYQDRILTGHGGNEEKRISGYVTGWGHTKNSYQPLIFNQAEITIQTLTRCTKDAKLFTENMICAIGKEGQDACKGDSGGPFVVRMNQRWIQVGIVSHGTTGDCGKSQVGFYTSVPMMMEWIRSKVGKVGFE